MGEFVLNYEKNNFETLIFDAFVSDFEKMILKLKFYI